MKTLRVPYVAWMGLTLTSWKYDCSLVVDALASQQQRQTTRADFLKLATTVTISGSFMTPEAASARGRATLDYTYERYTPRINAGTKFYSSDFRKLIERADFAGIKAATMDPPKRTKEDKAKADGGFTDRVAQAGGFSDARVLVAADLFAASFSDNSISSKTKNMQAQVAIVRDDIAKIQSAARIALGEEKAGGGFFGIGAKKPSPKELMLEIQKSYVEAGNAWNQYILYANDGLPVQYTRLPFL